MIGQTAVSTIISSLIGCGARYRVMVSVSRGRERGREPGERVAGVLISGCNDSLVSTLATPPPLI